MVTLVVGDMLDCVAPNAAVTTKTNGTSWLNKQTKIIVYLLKKPSEMQHSKNTDLKIKIAQNNLPNYNSLGKWSFSGILAGNSLNMSFVNQTFK